MTLLGVLGGREIFLILLVVLILFGGQKIPELMRGLGKGIREFKKARDGVDEEVRHLLDDEPSLHDDSKLR